MQMMISGHDHDSEYGKGTKRKEPHIDHNLLRANKPFSKMKPEDQKIYQYE